MMDQKSRGNEQKHAFQQIPNPYVPGMPLKPGSPTFLGREDVFEFIQQSLSAPTRELVLVLTGERRTGKTTILRQLPARLKNTNYIPVYVDGQVLGIDPGIGNFFFSLAAAIVDGVQEAGISPPLLTLADLEESPQRTFEQSLLPMVRERIGNRILLLAIDEFEELGDRVSRGRLPADIFSYLRHLIQHEERLAFIFAGTHKVEELTGEYWSVLFNIALHKRIGFLKREETVRLITEPVKPYGMAYDELAIDEMLCMTGCHPYFTQLLCNILVNQCKILFPNLMSQRRVSKPKSETAGYEPWAHRPTRRQGESDS
jgi:hypothetical protein